MEDEKEIEEGKTEAFDIESKSIEELRDYTEDKLQEEGGEK